MKNKNTKNLNLALLLLTVTLVLICIIVISIVCKENTLINMLLENAYYISQIICMFAVIITAYMAIKQYKSSKETETKYYENVKTEKALELLEYYKDNVSYNMEFIRKLYEGLGLTKVMNAIEIKYIKEFSLDELNKVVDAENIENTWGKYINTNLDMLYRDYGKPINMNQDDTLGDEAFKDYITKTIRNIEYFSSYFVYETADINIIYDSLRTTYIENIRLLYYDIVMYNKNYNHTKCINTIKLFDKLRDISCS